MKKIKHFLYCPFTGLGLYGGFRGDRWLKNRIQIFKQFVVPSLLVQTSQNFTLWISWRPEERNNKRVKELKSYLDNLGLSNIFTYSGVCFWDDKYPDEVARRRLSENVLRSLQELFNEIGSVDEVYMTIQPSDDCYHKDTVKQLQELFRNSDLQAAGFTKGYVMNYKTLELKHWNPKTIPPFFTIKFPTPIFIDPYKHIEYTGPYKSHEYIGDKLKFGKIDVRGFLVGTHGENISTVFNHPFAEDMIEPVDLSDFGLDGVLPLKIKYSVRKRILRALPYRVQRKLRYLFGERFYARLYEWLRS